MTQATIALLPDRGVVSVTGEDADSFLDNLITNDMTKLKKPGDAMHAGLLSPQGKILFEFFVVKTAAGFLLETALEQTAALAKRLAMYKLRAKVAIKDAAGEVIVGAAQGDVRARPGGAISFVDPRDARLGDRVLIPATAVGESVAQTGAQRLTPESYHKLRIELGVPEAGADYVLGDTFPHEADFDQLNGVSFTKGCFVGQEVVARMENKTVVRKRVVPLSSDAALPSGAEVKAGEAAIGKVGSAAGPKALAMVRLDRIIEAIDKGEPITVDGAKVTVDPGTLQRYRRNLEEKRAHGG